MLIRSFSSVVFRIGLTGTLLSLLIGLSSSGAEDPVQTEISHLLAFVRESDCVFIRNGRVHESTDAETHIKRKYDYFKDRITTAEKFIDLAASRSTRSGRIYTVRCGEREMPSGTWLRFELDAFRRRISKERAVTAN